MIIKQCQFPTQDSRGEHLHLLHPGYNNAHLLKTAAETASAPQLERIMHVMKGMERNDNLLYALISAMGAGEYWGDNSNADDFPEVMPHGIGKPSLIHAPLGWDTLSYPQQVSVGKGWEWGFPTFYNAHAFAHHRNQDPNRAFGSVAYVLWDEHMKRVLLVVAFDRMRAQAQDTTSILTRIDNGEFPSVSMGCRVPYDVCLDPSTLIRTKRGPVRIQEVVVGDLVQTHKDRWRPVTQTFRRTADRIIEIQPVGVPDPIRCTPNHPIYMLCEKSVRGCQGSANGLRRRHRVDREGLCSFCGKQLDLKPQWVSASEVVAGAYLLTPVGAGTTKFSLLHARLMGMYLGDGCPIRQRRGRKRDGEYVLQGVQFSAGTDEKEHIDDLVDLLRRCSRKNLPRVYKEGDKNAVTIRLYDQHLAASVVELCGEGSRGKHLPSDWMDWEPEARFFLLGGLIDTDGSEDTPSNNRSRCGVRYVTANESLAWEVRDLALSLGIPATFRRQRTRSGYAPGALAYWISLPSASLSPLNQFSLKVKAVVSRGGARLFFWKNYVCTPVRSVRSLTGSTETCNLAVEEDESYVAGGFVVHNCGHCADWSRITGDPRLDLAEHRRSPIQGLSPTVRDYCEHLRTQLGRIYPDGRKAKMINLHPRFFDISVVYIGADKTSFILGKLAGECPIRSGHVKCASCAEGRIIPSSHVYEVWTRDEEQPMPKQAQGIEDLTLSDIDPVTERRVDAYLRQVRDELAQRAKQGSEPKVALDKDAEIEKAVKSNFEDRLPAIEASEPEIPLDVQDAMAKDVPGALASAAGAGVVLRPGEFQRIMIISMGRPGLADSLHRSGIGFEPGSDELPFPLPDQTRPDFLRMLLPLIMGRSAFAPPLHRRTVVIMAKAAPEKQAPVSKSDVLKEAGDNALLRKIAALYRGYRRGLIYKVAGLARDALRQEPQLLDHVLGQELFRSGLAKRGGDVLESILRTMPTTYLNRAYLEEPVSEYVDQHCDLHGLKMAGALAQAGGVA